MEKPSVQAKELSQQEDQVAKVEVQGNSSLIILPQGPIMRSRAEKSQQALNYHLQGLVKITSEGLQGIQSFGASEDQKNFILLKIVSEGDILAQGC